SQRIDLVAPGVPAFRKAVAQQNKRALALLDDIQADAVGLDHPLDRFAHVPRPAKTGYPKHAPRAYSPRTARTKQGLPAKLQGIYVGGYWQRSHPYVLGWMSAARNPSPSRYGRPSSAPLR